MSIENLMRTTDVHKYTVEFWTNKEELGASNRGPAAHGTIKFLHFTNSKISVEAKAYKLGNKKQQLCELLKVFSPTTGLFLPMIRIETEAGEFVFTCTKGYKKIEDAAKITSYIAKVIQYGNQAP
jgi:hypothetical protein